MQKGIYQSQDPKMIGQRVKLLILQHDHSIAQFSLRTGIPLTTLYPIIRGQRLPTHLTMIRLSHYLDCSVDFLLGVSSPEMDPTEGYESAVLNISEFADFWSPTKIRYLMKLLEKDPAEKAKWPVHPVDRVRA